MVLVWRGHESADGGARPLPSTMACRRPSSCGAAISIPKQRLLRVRHGEAAGPGLREPQRQLTLPPATRPRPQTHGSTPNLHPEPRSRPVAHLHPKLHLETAVWWVWWAGYRINYSVSRLRSILSAVFVCVYREAKPAYGVITLACLAVC